MKFGLGALIYEIHENFSSVSLIVSKKRPIETFAEMDNCHFLTPESCSGTQNFTNKVQRRIIAAFQWSSPYLFLKKVILTFRKG